MDASFRIACTDAGSETESSARRRMFKDEYPWDATTVTRHSGHNELWIDADWLLGRRMNPRPSDRRSWGLLAAAVILFCIGPAMQATKKPARRDAGRSGLQKLPSAPLVGTSRAVDGGGMQGNRLGSARALATNSIADTDSVLKVALSDNPNKSDDSVTPDFLMPTAKEFVALPLDVGSNFCDEALDHLLSMGLSEPSWSPTAFWHTTCRTSWGESPWGLRPDAWVIPAVSMSEGMQ